MGLFIAHGSWGADIRLVLKCNYCTNSLMKQIDPDKRRYIRQVMEQGSFDLEGELDLSKGKYFDGQEDWQIVCLHFTQWTETKRRTYMCPECWKEFSSIKDGSTTLIPLVLKEKSELFGLLQMNGYIRTSKQSLHSSTAEQRNDVPRCKIVPCWGRHVYFEPHSITFDD